MFSVLRDIVAYRDLLWTMVVRNLKVRYKRSVLGFFWTLLNPLFLILIYATFLRILRFYDATNPLFLPMLVSGIIVWQFLAMSLGDALYSVLGNANLVTKTSFPRVILPLAMVLANLINFLLSLVILVVYLLIESVPFGPVWLLPGIILTQFALCLGLSLILASLNVFFRDTEHILSVVLLAWFFLTPIIYPLEKILDNLAPEYHRLVFLNPMTGLVTAYRAAFISTDLMAPRLVAMSFVMAWIICLFGIAVFKHFEVRIADEL